MTKLKDIVCQKQNTGKDGCSAPFTEQLFSRSAFSMIFFNKIFLKCITSGYEFTLIQYLLLYYHNTCLIIFNSEIC